MARKSGTSRPGFLVVLSFSLMVLLIAMVVSLSTGSAGYKPLDVLRVLLGREGGPARSIVWGIRLPRTLLSVLVGAALGISGVLVQTATRNPLAEPYLLGISSGALVATGLAILTLPAGLAFSTWITLTVSFAGGLAAFLVVLLLARLAGGSPTSLILAGIAVSSFLSGTTILLSLLVQSKLGSFIIWLLGSFLTATMDQVKLILPVVAGVTAASLALAGRLDLLLMGDEVAVQGGVDPERMRRTAVALAALATAVSVGVAGVIGFVGLVVPHMSRFLAGIGHRRTLVLSAVLGGALLCMADAASRAAGRILLLGELPVGAVTALIGAPFFAFLLVRFGRRSQW